MLHYMNTAFTALFFVECVLKIVSFGVKVFFNSWSPGENQPVKPFFIPFFNSPFLIDCRQNPYIHFLREKSVLTNNFYIEKLSNIIVV